MMITDLLQFLFHFILIGFPALLRQVWRPWEQVIQKIKVCVVFMFRYFSQEILYILIDFQIVCFCSFCNAVDYGAGSGSADGIDQPPVVLSDAEAAQCGFCRIVIQGDFAVFQKYAQISFLIYGIDKGFSCLGFWRDFTLVFFYPLKISVNQGFQLKLPPVPPFLWRKSCQFIVKFIDRPDLLQGIMGKRAFTLFLILYGFQGICIFAPCMGLIRELE